MKGMLQRLVHELGCADLSPRQSAVRAMVMRHGEVSGAVDLRVTVVW